MREREIEKIAKKQGFSKTNFGKGSHEVLKHPDGRTSDDT
ncbi:type II toxin-antitoxin system HicA family toxin [Streptococcus suis]|nr:type II toxin-antitoxin system HicA family toxin [Streptococcus suis]